MKCVRIVFTLMVSNSVALIIAKGNSRRLKNKNWLDFNGKPMFAWNVIKCVKIFKQVYVSSDSEYILRKANQLGAIPIKRPLELCQEGVPNIPVYLHAYDEMNPKPDIIVSVQANSPTLKEWRIEEVKKLMEIMGYGEMITCHADYKIYGSIWALNAFTLNNYESITGSHYKHKPNCLLPDPSVDIHNLYDLTRAKN